MMTKFEFNSSSLFSVQDVRQGPSLIIDFFAPKYIIDSKIGEVWQDFFLSLNLGPTASF